MCCESILGQNKCYVNVIRCQIDLCIVIRVRFQCRSLSYTTPHPPWMKNRGWRGWPWRETSGLRWMFFCSLHWQGWTSGEGTPCPKRSPERCRRSLSVWGSGGCWWRRSWRRWPNAAAWAVGCLAGRWAPGPGRRTGSTPPSRWSWRGRCWSRSPQSRSSRRQGVGTNRGEKWG